MLKNLLSIAAVFVASHANAVTFTEINKVHNIQIPNAGVHSLSARGARGGSAGPALGGSGIKITAEMAFAAKAKVAIVVGEKGSAAVGLSGGGGGGGATFFLGLDRAPLVIAGGGGGAGQTSSGVYRSGIRAAAGQSGANGRGDGSDEAFYGVGGSNGHGGGTFFGGGGGAGHFTDGESGPVPVFDGRGGTARSFEGGASDVFGFGGRGGFGGGGGGGIGGGGGGGYSGGGGGWYDGGGGGGSFVAAGSTNIKIEGTVSSSGFAEIEAIRYFAQVGSLPTMLDFGVIRGEPGRSKTLKFSVNNIAPDDRKSDKLAVARLRGFISPFLNVSLPDPIVARQTGTISVTLDASERLFLASRNVELSFSSLSARGDTYFLSSDNTAGLTPPSQPTAKVAVKAIVTQIAAYSVDRGNFIGDLVPVSGGFFYDFGDVSVGQDAVFCNFFQVRSYHDRPFTGIMAETLGGSFRSRSPSLGFTFFNSSFSDIQTEEYVLLTVKFDPFGLVNGEYTHVVDFSAYSRYAGLADFMLPGATFTLRANVFGAAPPLASVPEPATWAMLIVGFGLVGSSMRRRSLHTA